MIHIENQKKKMGYVDSKYLIEAAELIRPVKEYCFTELRCQNQYKILDAGCGPGTDTLPIAEMINQKGMVVGIDHDRKMIKEAENGCAAINCRIKHYQSTIEKMPFTSGFFDGCRCERVFQHLEKPYAALQEIIRVVRRKGRIVIADTDHSATSVDTSYPEIAMKLWNFKCRNLNNGYAAMKLYGMAEKCDLFNIKVKVISLTTTSETIFAFATGLHHLSEMAVKRGTFSQKQMDDFRLDLIDKNRAGTFFGSMNFVVLSATVS